ncbi:DUF4822 domain-containing protein [Segetibacter sp. 3557_3]|uniref:DUF4822 domain-containing protein n=1 Tax=Segetibacter sp. 3557_3 TaxID=2547429 RepID=UPI00105896A4|nr:DUF4822 domain-containing protein [Segetibacter sp. 3557_3]TDH23530.1 DUF4822 domain-containing protein [Segetibacter sp. 3557_3]
MYYFRKTILSRWTLWSISFIMLCLVVSCSKDDEMSRAEILSSTRWKSTAVKDSVGVDVTPSFQNFMGLATYNRDGTYEFFTLDGAPRGDRGLWALTVDGNKRILNSTTLNYTRVVDIVELNTRIFTYRVNASGKTVTVEHVPIQ